MWKSGFEYIVKMNTTSKDLILKDQEELKSKIEEISKQLEEDNLTERRYIEKKSEEIRSMEN